MTQAAKLALEDGTVLNGTSFGAPGEVLGEVCFNTSMTGYQEILTDPSYRGQIVTMTYPEIGNYGINPDDLESAKPHLAGFVVRQSSRRASNFRSEEGLREYLLRWNIPGIADVDTRALVRKLRDKGAMKGILSTLDLDDASLVNKARNSAGLVGRDLVREVMPAQQSQWGEKLHPLMNTSFSDALVKNFAGTDQALDASRELPHVVAIDYGMKWNIPRHLAQQGCRVTVVPGTITADEILSLRPRGVFLSNGPGDPEPLDYAIKTIQGVLGKVPVFGICLGHQLLALACGAKTFKLKFGHRGANQPVMNHDTGRVEITSQNHGFAVDPESLPAELEVTHTNLNDNTIEGVRHKTLPAFSVQYHPEASAGPHDSQYLFSQFHRMMGTT